MKHERSGCCHASDGHVQPAVYVSSIYMAGSDGLSNLARSSTLHVGGRRRGVAPGKRTDASENSYDFLVSWCLTSSLPQATHKTMHPRQEALAVLAKARSLLAAECLDCFRNLCSAVNTGEAPIHRNYAAQCAAKRWQLSLCLACRSASSPSAHRHYRDPVSNKRGSIS